MKKIIIGGDHASVEMKDVIKEHLTAKGIEMVDFGTQADVPVDYPDIGEKVARAVAAGEADSGIIICGTGIGISMAANKISGIRAALCCNSFMALKSREHNDANILALGARVLGIELALDIVDTFVETPFSGDERHVRRVNKIKALDK